MKRILCFGDSNTYGYIPENGQRYAVNERWTGILQEKVRALDYEVIEEGLVGRTTIFEDAYRPGRNGLSAFPGLLKEHADTDILVLMLGTNDCKILYGQTAEGIAHGLEQLLQLARDPRLVEKPLEIILLSPIHLGEEVWREEFDPEFNQNSVQVSKGLAAAYRRLAYKYGCHFLAASDVAEPSAADQEHLTMEGHAALADYIFGEVLSIDRGFREEERRRVS